MVCSGCGDRKYIKRDGVMVRCECLVRSLQESAWREAWIPPVYWPLTWESLKSRKADAGVFEQTRKFERHAEAAMQEHAGLYLSGPIGSCKTTVAILIAKHWALMEGISVRYVLYASVYQAKCGGENSLKGNVDDLLDTANLLVLDEIGREPDTRTGYDVQVMDEVLRRRETCSGHGDRGAATILTTNIPFGKIGDRYSANVRSLLDGRYLDFVLKTKDVRNGVGKELRSAWARRA